MCWSWYINIICYLVVINAYFTYQTADYQANTKTKQILAYITDLPKKGKVLSGQFAGYSPDTFNTSQLTEIVQQTGKIPAILGCDYACGWNYQTSPENLIDYTCNPSLKEHWNKDGLVTVNMHLPNPVSLNGGGYKDRMNLNFADITDTNTETGQRWRRFLDRIATGLNDLQEAGVTVLYRPLHEMNGNWFYWCDQDPDQFKNVWKDMFHYLVDTKNLHNLLWVYSPDQGPEEPTKYYPGDSYVDIVSLDVYTDNPDSMKGYYEMLSLNKPFALGELGPRTLDSQFDYTRWISAFQSKFPEVTYFLTWNDGWSPLRNKNTYAFFNNERIINRGEMNLNVEMPSSKSTILYNFSNGIGLWTGSNIVDGPWQSNEFVFQSTDSLKADIQLTAGGQYILYTRDKSTFKFSGRNRLIAQARTAPSGFDSNGRLDAKIYIKTGSDWNWYDSGAVQLNSNTSTAIVFDLSGISSDKLNDVREFGIELNSNANGGRTSVYLSHVDSE